MKDKIKIFLTICFLSICYLCLGQSNVKKVIDEDGKGYLVIWYKKGKDTVNFNFPEGFENKLTDAEKLELIKCLLKFEGDTTRHSGMVYPNYYASNEIAVRFSPKSKFFTLEINALYFINRVAYGTFTDYYSAAPVLYDNEEKVEINDQPDKIAMVFTAYKNWFEACIKSGKIPKYFPFNDERYVWLRGKKSLYLKDGRLIENFYPGKFR